MINTTSVTCGAGYAYFFRASEINSDFGGIYVIQTYLSYESMCFVNYFFHHRQFVIDL